MAGETLVGKNRAYVAVELNSPVERVKDPGEPQQDPGRRDPARELIQDFASATGSHRINLSFVPIMTLQTIALPHRGPLKKSRRGFHREDAN